MTVRFRTETGSTYEVDLGGRRARRLSGAKEPTRRFGGDGEWQAFREVSAVELGAPVVFSWEPDPRLDDVRMKHNTVTSAVVDIVVEG